MEGTYASYVNRLSFTTNFGNTLNWPPSPDSGTGKFSWDEDATTKLLGFDGRSGGYLDAIAPVTGKFFPAQWVGYPDSAAHSRVRDVE